LVVLLTPQSVARQWVIAEIAMAAILGKRIVPILYHVKPDEMFSLIRDAKAYVFGFRQKVGRWIMTSSDSPRVFLSHNHKDAGLASFVTSALETQGGGVFTVLDLSPGTQIEKAIREDLVASTAVVILATPNSVSSQNLAFEADMAMAVQKPIFVLYDGVALSQLPSFIAQYKVFPVSQTGKVSQQILSAQKKFTDDEVAMMIEAYQDLGVPLDQLVMNSELLTTLTASISSRVNNSISGEKVARLLMTRRKQGKLPRTRTVALPA
jgi:hypothetical protein